MKKRIAVEIEIDTDRGYCNRHCDFLDFTSYTKNYCYLFRTGLVEGERCDECKAKEVGA